MVTVRLAGGGTFKSHSLSEAEAEAHRKILDGDTLCRSIQVARFPTSRTTGEPTKWGGLDSHWGIITDSTYLHHVTTADKGATYDYWVEVYDSKKALELDQAFTVTLPHLTIITELAACSKSSNCQEWCQSAYQRLKLPAPWSGNQVVVAAAGTVAVLGLAAAAYYCMSTPSKPAAAARKRQ